MTLTRVTFWGKGTQNLLNFWGNPLKNTKTKMAPISFPFRTYFARFKAIQTFLLPLFNKIGYLLNASSNVHWFNLQNWCGSGREAHDSKSNALVTNVLSVLEMKNAFWSSYCNSNGPFSKCVSPKSFVDKERQEILVMRERFNYHPPISNGDRKPNT